MNVLFAGLLATQVTTSAPTLKGSSPAPGQASAAALSNADVIKMVQAKLGDGIIITKIKSSATKFDTATEELIRLKKAGVSDLVLQAMTEAGRPSASVSPGPLPAAAAGDSNDPLSPHASGIFYFQGAEHRMILVEPTVYSET